MDRDPSENVIDPEERAVGLVCEEIATLVILAKDWIRNGIDDCPEKAVFIEKG